MNQNQHFVSQINIHFSIIEYLNSKSIFNQFKICNITMNSVLKYLEYYKNQTHNLKIMGIEKLDLNLFLTLKQIEQNYRQYSMIHKLYWIKDLMNDNSQLSIKTLNSNQDNFYSNIINIKQQMQNNLIDVIVDECKNLQIIVDNLIETNAPQIEKIRLNKKFHIFQHQRKQICKYQFSGQFQGHQGYCELNNLKDILIRGLNMSFYIYHNSIHQVSYRQTYQFSEEDIIFAEGIKIQGQNVAVDKFGDTTTLANLLTFENNSCQFGDYINIRGDVKTNSQQHLFMSNDNLNSIQLVDGWKLKFVIKEFGIKVQDGDHEIEDDNHNHFLDDYDPGMDDENQNYNDDQSENFESEYSGTHSND